MYVVGSARSIVMQLDIPAIARVPRPTFGGKIPREMDATWPYRPYEQCPCGGGKKAKFCCRTPRGAWRVSPVKLRMPEPVSGYANPCCYARGDGDCSSKSSGEHYVPKSALRLFGKAVRLSGPKFLTKGEKRDIPISGMVSNVLCVRHNSSMSPLDDVAKSFFAVMDRYLRELGERQDAPPEGAAANELRLFNGDDIERVLLKCLCGLCAAQVIDTMPVPHPLMLDILLRGAEFPRGWGLCIDTSEAGVEEGTLAAEIRIGVSATEFAMQFAKHSLILNFSEHPREGLRVRPSLIVFQRGSTAKAIHLNYSGTPGGGYARITIHDSWSTTSAS